MRTHPLAAVPTDRTEPRGLPGWIARLLVGLSPAQNPRGLDAPALTTGQATDRDGLARTLELARNLREAASPIPSTPRLRIVREHDTVPDAYWQAFASLPDSEARSRWQALFAPGRAS